MNSRNLLREFTAWILKYMMLSRISSDRFAVLATDCDTGFSSDL